MSPGTCMLWTARQDSWHVKTVLKCVYSCIVDNVRFRKKSAWNTEGDISVLMYWFRSSIFLNCPQWDRHCFSKSGAYIAHNYSHSESFLHWMRIHSSHETEPLIQRALQERSQWEKKDQPPLQCTREHACAALKHTSKYVIPSFEPGRFPVFALSAM